MGPKILAIVLIVFGLGLVVYFFNSGGAAQLGSFVKGSVSTSSGGIFSLFPPPHSSPVGSSSNGTSGGESSSSTTGGVSSSTATSTPKLSIPASQIPKGFTIDQLSPYFHQIRFGSVSTGQISLHTSFPTASTTMDVTNWEIKTNRGGEFIPQAATFYDPSGANFFGDVILVSGGVLNIYSNSSPSNVRIYECMGYLNQTKQFNPAFPANCPPVDKSAISTFTGKCQNYINSLYGCATANLSNPSVPVNDYACQEFLEDNYTYNSCVTDHHNDKNFFTGEWRVWMGGSPLDPYHDIVELLDTNGLLVDIHTY